MRVRCRLGAHVRVALTPHAHGDQLLPLSSSSRCELRRVFEMIRLAVLDASDNGINPIARSDLSAAFELLPPADFAYQPQKSRTQPLQAKRAATVTQEVDATRRSPDDERPAMRQARNTDHSAAPPRR